MLKNVRLGLKALLESDPTLVPDGAAQGNRSAAGAGVGGGWDAGPAERARLSRRLAELCRLQHAQSRGSGWLDEDYRLRHPDEAWVFRLLHEMEMFGMQKSLPTLWRDL